jgi:hypothetical protein
MYLQNDVRAQTDPVIVRRMAAIAALHPHHQMVLAISKVPDSLQSKWTKVNDSTKNSKQAWQVFDRHLDNLLMVIKEETDHLVRQEFAWSKGREKNAKSEELLKHAKFRKGFMLAGIHCFPDITIRQGVAASHTKFVKEVKAHASKYAADMGKGSRSWHAIAKTRARQIENERLQREKTKELDNEEAKKRKHSDDQASWDGVVLVAAAVGVTCGLGVFALPVVLAESAVGLAAGALTTVGGTGSWLCVFRSKFHEKLKNEAGKKCVQLKSLLQSLRGDEQDLEFEVQLYESVENLLRR